MKISRKKFVIIFLVSAFAFQFISNSVLGPEIRLFPVGGGWFPGTGSPIAWKSTLAAIIYPIKFILIGPFANVLVDPDPPPPLHVVIFTVYWTALAFILHFLLSKMFPRKKANAVQL